METEYDGGTIINQCPECGQFCKRPDTYHPQFALCVYRGEMWKEFDGCVAESYCRRCKKEVKLPVEFV